MPALGETVAIVIVVGLAILLTIRLLFEVAARVRRVRRPEARAILVVGVGGGGNNAVDRMVSAGIRAVSFVAFNTDAQALRRSRAQTRIRIGDSITGGLGSGGDPEIGRRAAEEDAEWIGRAVAGADLVFVTAGLGGGTGSGAGPIVAAKARDQGALTIAVVTKPFGFEGSQRKRVADAAAAELATNVDALIVVPNDRVGGILTDDATMIDAFAEVDDVLLHVVQGIIDVISAPGLINLDFADIRSVMKDAGPALVGLGHGVGEHRATDAARQAIAGPLLEASIEGARGILLNVSGPDDLRLREVQQAAEEVRKHADDDANIIFGASFSKTLGDEVLVTLIATRLNGHERTRTTTLEASSNGGHRVDVEARPPSRRPVRPVREAPGVEAVTSAADVSVEVPQPPSTAAPTLDDGELEVPSFLRRRRQPTGRD